jgi:hypothetical protein
MAKKADIPAAIFQLRAIELHELVISRLAPGLQVNNFTFDIGIETNIDQNQKVVIVSTLVRITADDKITELGRVNCACVFSVQNFEEVIVAKDDHVFELANSFAEAINSIAISTTRGFMASELKGTILHYAFLPIIDVKTLSKATI